MRYSAPLLALPVTALAVTLADFKPRASDLPSSCQAVYTQTIDGCSPSDFSSSAGCSKGCVKALAAFTTTVKSACRPEDIDGTNIITAFLDNAGPQGLCTNANAILGSGSSSDMAAQATTAASSISSTTAVPSTISASAAAISHSNADSTTSEGSTSSMQKSSSTILSGTKTASSLANFTSAPSSTATLAVDTSSAPSAATPSASSSRANGKGDSGGGSPFDTEGNLASSGIVAAVPCEFRSLGALLALLAILR